MWLGPKPMPELFRGFSRDWERLNPEWVVRDWSWHNLPTDLANQDVIDDLIYRANKNQVGLATALADVIAYDLVARYGGVYSNADIAPIRSVEKLPNYDWRNNWATYEDSEFAVNAIFGGPCGSKFWTTVVNGLSERYWRMYGDEMNRVTGPHYLTEMWRRHPEELIVYPTETFNPVIWWDIPPYQSSEETYEQVKNREFSESVFGIHLWNHRSTMRSNIVD